MSKSYVFKTSCKWKRKRNGAQHRIRLGGAEENTGRLSQIETGGEENKVEEGAWRMSAVCFKVNQINKINNTVSCRNLAHFTFVILS